MSFTSQEIRANGKLTFHNIKPIGAAEKVMFSGEPHYTFPCVIFQTGVWNRILYSKEVLNENVHAWNGVPVPIRHPEGVAGEVIGCNTPTEWDARVVGNFFEAKFTDKEKLVGTVYVSEARLKSISPETLAMVVNNQTMELSTGMWQLLEAKTGELDGKEYDYISQGIIPDHLALLPNEIGAFSVADGAGTMKVNKKDGKQITLSISTKEGLETNQKMLSTFESEMRNALREKYLDSYVYVMDIDIQGKVVYFEVETDLETTKTYKTSSHGMMYGEKEGAISFIGEPFNVRKEVVYTPVMNTSSEEDDTMKIEQLVKDLIGNEATKFTEKDEEWLKGLNEDQLGLLIPNVAEEKKEEKEEKKEEPEKKTDVVVNVADPKEMATMVANLVAEGIKTAFSEREREPIIQSLVMNKECPVPEADLRAMSLDGLNALNETYTKKTDFSLRNFPALIDNAGEDSDGDMPKMPSLLLAVNGDKE